MPRSSPYVIRLSSAEEAELSRRVAKYTLPYFQVQRAKMILYAAQGLSNDEIAACASPARPDAAAAGIITAQDCQFAPRWQP